ncbi:MAG TPA: penicillin-binding protein 2 [Candidatus Ignatzschineria merdigallinarum]|uniref:Peptidoglycan D,D-transpeptidase MrdA n=1 Tax=Candidatus Ignatzschineria merdigallinarum TaxID=2838621 RepID=A0A9D1Q7U5_9GAMM|nr:penicillin-binding protein 2 [Candidatus Ignatzschineria merdigallinarum]
MLERPQKKQPSTNNLFLGRSLIGAFLVLVGLIFLIVRLFHLQVIEHDLYTTRSNDNRIKLLPLPPTRGQIFDRNGEILATNVPVYNLEIIRQDLTEPLENVLASINELLPISEDELSRFERAYRRANRQESVVLKKGLNEDESAQIAINLHKLNGVHLRANLVRIYPHKNRAVHAIGYVGRVDTRDIREITEQGLEHEYSGITHIGKRGAEKSFENILRGTMGFETVEASSSGRTVRKISEVPPIPGKNIYLTLDLRLQILAEEALEDYDGAIVALDPQSGDILAFVSKPTYDPNLFVDGITHKDFNELNTDPSTPFLNRVMQGLYPPGSVIKPQIGLAGLENDFITEKTIINCKGYFSVPGNNHRFRDMGYYGPSDLRKALERSCDVYFYELAYNMGVTTMTDFLKPFALGTKTNVDLIGESAGVAPTPEYKRQRFKQPWYTGDTITAGIGQSYWLTTPLQIAQSTAIVGMRGDAFEPHILGATAMPPSNQKEFVIPTPISPIILKDDHYWDAAIDGMVSVVHGARGTARTTKSADYVTAGKTGTAQVKTIAQGAKYDAKNLDRRHHDHAWYVAFAPAEAPKIAIAVIVENGGSGSRVAAPIAKKVYDAWLKDFNTPFAKETLARIKAEEISTFMPNDDLLLPELQLESIPFIDDAAPEEEKPQAPSSPSLKSLMNIRLGAGQLQKDQTLNGSTIRIQHEI